MWRSHSLQTLPDRKRHERDTSETIESQVRIISQMLLVCLSLQQSMRDDFTKVRSIRISKVVSLASKLSVFASVYYNKLSRERDIIHFSGECWDRGKSLDRKAWNNIISWSTIDKSYDQSLDCVKD